jgi:hypothetical protein
MLSGNDSRMNLAAEGYELPSQEGSIADFGFIVKIGFKRLTNRWEG